MEIEREDPDVTAEVTERYIDAKTSEDFDRATELEGANISNSIYTDESSKKICLYLADNVPEDELVERFNACGDPEEKRAAYKEAALNQNAEDTCSVLKAQNLEKAWKDCVEARSVYNYALTMTDPRKE